MNQQVTAAARAPHAVVIGSGIGGSALTLLLAHAGLAVTLLEKNKHLGGSCAGYDKLGFRIDFGTHLFTRGPSGPLGQVLRRTGHPDALQFRRTRDLAELRYTARASTQETANLRLPWRAHRAPAFAFRLVRQLDLSAAETGQTMRLLTKLLTMSPRAADAWNHRTFEEFVHRHCSNPRLATLVTFALGLAFVLPPWEISAGEAIYCLQRTARDNTLGYPLGGSRAVPTTYCRLAQQMGARVRTRAHVRRIIVEHGRVRGVELHDGTRIGADLVISTSSVRTTALRLCDPGALPDTYLARTRNITGSQTAVQVKIALNRKLVHTGLLLGLVSDTSDPLRAGQDTVAEALRRVVGGQVPDVTPVYCPVPTNFDPALAPPGHQLLTACTLAPTNDIERQAPERAWEEALMSAMRHLVPGLDDHVLFVDRTTVPWMEHWIGKEHGPAISTAQTPEQVGAMRPSVTTPVTGLYIAGCGAGGRGVGAELAADSAMECAERLLTDLGMRLPATWRTPRHQSPSLARGFLRALLGAPGCAITQ